MSIPVFAYSLFEFVFEEKKKFDGKARKLWSKRLNELYSFTESPIDFVRGNYKVLKVFTSI